MHVYQQVKIMIGRTCTAIINICIWRKLLYREIITIIIWHFWQPFIPAHMCFCVEKLTLCCPCIRLQWLECGRYINVNLRFGIHDTIHDTRPTAENLTHSLLRDTSAFNCNKNDLICYLHYRAIALLWSLSLSHIYLVIKSTPDVSRSTCGVLPCPISTLSSIRPDASRHV